MLLRKFEMPWRTAFEAYAAAVWAISVCVLLYMWQTAIVPRTPFLLLACLAGTFFTINLWRSWEIWRLKWSLGGKSISFITDPQLQKKVDDVKGSLWVGKGFDWTPVHTQRVYEIKRADPEQFYPPKAIMWIAEQWCPVDTWCQCR